MTTKSNKDLNFTFGIFILLLFVAFAAVSCGTIRIKNKLIGKTSIERKFDEKGALIYYKKTNTKSTRFISHPHNGTIIRTKKKVFENHKLSVLYFQKSIKSMTNWDGKVLKSKRIVWDENRKKTVTRIPLKIKA
ncbi:hypothetical protein [Cytophaga aurantiaca]|uniref:hypothetical protein n=1 Tax=Cytophaga aurantiaca TaxID=29530 RepID=UPI000379D5E4|nr:hypothetical protein [Cytophaga aurantiaca]